MCEYVDRELGIGYREDQKDLKAVAYTDPSDLFLNGVMDRGKAPAAIWRPSTSPSGGV